MKHSRPDIDARRARLFVTSFLRQGWLRARGSFVPILQSAVGAALAWFIAHDLLGRPDPMFAPIATWVCLGFKLDRVPRKVAELGAGATLGVLVGEAFTLVFQAGAWQIFVVLVVSALLGRFLDRGDLFTIQSGVNGIVVLAMTVYAATASGGTTTPAGRGSDALVGSLVAFVFAVLMPRHPTERPRRYAANALTEFARTLEMLAHGLKTADVEEIQEAALAHRSLRRVMDTWEQTLVTAREVVNLNPTLRRERPVTRELDRLYRLARRADRSAMMLNRQSLGMSEEVGRIPVLGGLIADTAVAMRAIVDAVRAWERPTRAQELLKDVARRSDPTLMTHREGWRPVALMSLQRALVVDLLQMTGLSRAQARALLPESQGRPFAVDAPIPPDRSDDATSILWGVRMYPKPDAER